MTSEGQTLRQIKRKVGRYYTIVFTVLRFFSSPGTFRSYSGVTRIWHLERQQNCHVVFESAPVRGNISTESQCLWQILAEQNNSRCKERNTFLTQARGRFKQAQMHFLSDAKNRRPVLDKRCRNELKRLRRLRNLQPQLY